MTRARGRRTAARSKPARERDWLGALLRLAAKAPPEESCAACIVLGALKPATPRVSLALVRALRGAPTAAAPYVLEALARQGDATGLAETARHLRSAGAMRDLALRLLRHFGDRGARAAADAAASASENALPVFLRAAAATRSTAAVDWFCDLLRTAAFPVARAVLRLTRGGPMFGTATLRRRWAAGLAAVLDAPNGTVTGRIAALKLLRFARTRAAAGAVLRRLAPGAPPSLVYNAVLTLHVCGIPAKERRRAIEALAPLAADPSSPRIALPAFRALRSIPGALTADLLASLRATAHPRVAAEVARLSP